MVESPRVEPAVNQVAQIAVRPEPGLARGKWEAPSWVFVAVLAAASLAALGWAGRAVGRGRRRVR